MHFVLLHRAAPGLERRYDGPIPRHDDDGGGGSGLLDRLAAESRVQAAHRRRGLAAARAMADDLLRQRMLALADYRHQAVALIP